MDNPCIICKSIGIPLLRNNNLVYCPHCFHMQAQIASHISINLQSQTTIGALSLLMSQNTLIITSSELYNCLNDQIGINFDNVTIQAVDFNCNELHENQKYDTIIIYFLLNTIHSPLELMQWIERNYLTSSTNVYIYTKYYTSVQARGMGIINDNIVSDFTTNSMKKLCEQTSLILNGVHFQDTFQNYRIYYLISNRRSSSGDRSGSSNVIEHLVDELETDLYDIMSYRVTQYQFTLYRNILENILLDFTCKGYYIINCCLHTSIFHVFDLSYLIDAYDIDDTCNKNIDTLIIYDKNNTMTVWEKTSEIFNDADGSNKVDLMNLSTLGLFIYK